MGASNASPTFLGVAACDVFSNALEADVVITSAADCTPHVPGETSHAANGPNAIRAELAKYASDHDRWDFDKMDRSSIVRSVASLITETCQLIQKLRIQIER
jgi:hypothetical protein